MIKKIAVIGAGPAGLAAAITAAQRGHEVSLFESEKEIGGQLNMAKCVSGKEEFYETLRYYQNMIHKSGVSLFLNTEFKKTDAERFDEIIFAGGVLPRHLTIPGIELPHVYNYADVLKKKVKIGARVVIIGAGGIGIDTSMFLLKGSAPEDLTHFSQKWNIDQSYQHRGGLDIEKKKEVVQRDITLLQRRLGKPGAALGKTTAWIHREELKKLNVKFLNDLNYVEINSEGIVIDKEGTQQLIPADHIIVCAGQESRTALYDELQNAGVTIHLVGGARKAGELDARRAIEEGTEIGLKI